MSAFTNLQASVDAVKVSADAAVVKIDELKALVAAGNTGPSDAELDAVTAKVDAVAAQLAAAVA